MNVLLSEALAVAIVAVLGIALVFGRGGTMQKAREIFLGLGMLITAVLILVAGKPGGVSYGLLHYDALFLGPRAAIFLAACLFGRMIARTKQIQETRKPEALFLLAACALVCDLLLLSKSLALTYILIIVAAWIGAFLCGMSFRGAGEGEGLLKHWVQVSFATVLGMGGLVVVSVLAGGVQYENIATYVSTLPEYSPSRLFMVFVLYLPFLLVAGLFPFHLVQIDRDEGSPWAVQSIISVLLSGTILLALWSLGIRVFVTADPARVPDGMRFLQLCGLLGGFWLSFFALSQNKSKRLLSAVVGAAWSMLLISGAKNSPTAAVAVVYGASAVLLWGSLLSFVWSRLQERVADDMISSVSGAGQRYRTHGLLLISALASPVLLPAFPGFTGAILQLAALIEQRTLLLLVLFSGLLVLFATASARILAHILFRPMSEALPGNERNDLTRYDWRDGFSVAAILVGMVGMGSLGNRLFSVLHEAAKHFLN